MRRYAISGIAKSKAAMKQIVSWMEQTVSWIVVSRPPTVMILGSIRQTSIDDLLDWANGARTPPFLQRRRGSAAKILLLPTVQWQLPFDRPTSVG